MPGNVKTYLVYRIQGFSKGKNTRRSYVGVLEVPAGSTATNARTGAPSLPLAFD